MTVADLFARIGLKTDEEKAKSFSRAMTTAKTTLIGVTAVAAGASLAIQKITSDALKASAAFTQFETETGASAQELQKWQAVAQQTNQSAESVSSAIKAITSNQEKIRLGQGDISGYQLLGIDPRQDPFKILEELRSKTKNLSEGMKRNILSQMGVGAGMLQTLSLTNDEFDKLAKNAFIISPSAIKTLNDTKSSLDTAGRAIKYLKAQIAVALAPEIKKLTKEFINFIQVNEKGIIKGFQKAYTLVRKFTDAIINTVSMINAVINATLGWDKAIWVLVAALAVLNATFLLSPMGIFIAGIILLVALLDDLYVYSKGGKSLFGEFIKGLSDIDGILDKWGVFGDIIQGIIDGIKWITEKASTVREFFGEPTEKERSITGMTGGYAGLRAAAAESRGNVTNNINMNVYGSSDPEATGNAAANSLQRQLNGSSAQRSRNE